MERNRSRRWMAVLPLLGALLAACGGGDGTSSSSPATDPAPTTAGGAPTTVKDSPLDGPRSAPRWETITTFTGTGNQQTAPFEVYSDAIQWRVRWSCTSGTLAVTTSPPPPPRRAQSMVDDNCEKPGEGYAIHTGTLRLNVKATGPWEMKVDQQLDRPLNEPALPGMDTAPVIARGDFYNLEMKGKGSATIYQLPDGTRALRFEGFEVSNNTDLFVRLSEAPMPQNSAETVNTPFVEIGNLKSTVGTQNYVLPADLPIEKVRSVVIWCQPVSIAYLAAGLTRA